MSKYSSTSDFRDLLQSKFESNWEYFKRATGGLLFKVRDDGQLEMLNIQRPADLIPYYPYKVFSLSSNLDGCKIVISNESYLDQTIDNMEDLNSEYGVEDSFEPFNTDSFRQKKRELYRLYQQALVTDITDII